MRYLYLHGFASGPESRKGLHLDRALALRGVALERLDLNVPSFAALSPVRALEVVDRAAGEAGPVTLLGSSMGGWLSAVWASRRPGRVVRVVLLCPGFDLPSRWPALMGAEAFARWERDGTFVFEDGQGRPTPVGWRLVEETRALPSWPAVRCPALVLHGTRDEVVPFASSERWTREQADARLVALDDDHALLGHLERLTAEVAGFLGVGRGAGG